jgi:hypothetical protein
VINESSRHQPRTLDPQAGGVQVMRDVFLVGGAGQVYTGLLTRYQLAEAVPPPNVSI